MPTWSELDSQTQEDLLAWFNCSKPTAVDKRRLAKLATDGRFRAWECPECESRVYQGDPEDWKHFQGVDQVDYTSYPVHGDSIYKPEYLEKLCDSCRMSDTTTMPE